MCTGSVPYVHLHTECATFNFSCPLGNLVQVVVNKNVRGGGLKLSSHLSIDDPVECAHKDGLVGINAGSGAARKRGVSYLPRDHLHKPKQLKNVFDK
jgi:hypothetical protein